MQNIISFKKSYELFLIERYFGNPAIDFDHLTYVITLIKHVNVNDWLIPTPITNIQHDYSAAIALHLDLFLFEKNRSI